MAMDQAIQEREKQFYDEEWKKITVREIRGRVVIPQVPTLSGKRVLVCSCGTGIEAVQAALEGADVYAFDISETAVQNARAMAEFNKVPIEVQAMDFHHLTYPDDFFDIVYGSAILHHIDCDVVGRNIHRVLKPGGVAYFRENSDRNPLLRWIRRLAFGKPGGYQRQRFLFFRRNGTTDEYPLTEEEVRTLRDIFHGNLQRYNQTFEFFYLLNAMIFKKRSVGRKLRAFDRFVVRVLPFLRRYSFQQELWMQKPSGKP